MLVSLDWLNDYVALKDMSAQKIAEILTSLGFEVESIKVPTPFDEKLVVGRIITANKHPNADSLKVCKVDVGAGELLDIVCGAPNARVGLQVVVAKEGASLGPDFKIKKTKIRGEPSCGMMCSERELGLSDEHAGILELQGEHRLGDSIARFMGGDTILEVSVTPNRGDAASYIGLARELAAKLNRELKLPKVTTWTPTSDLKVDVALEHADQCTRFVGIPISNVKAIPSPKWMADRLVASGVRSINLLVDVTNYTLLEWGQPTHAYDARFVKGYNLSVRASGAGDKLRTLDGNDLALEPGDILVCDAERPVALAGIMGGENSEVSPETTEIILEVAHFSAAHVRKTSKRLALSTEGSYRFERGTNPEMPLHVAKRIVNLLQQCSQGAFEPRPGAIVDLCLETHKPPRVALRLERLKAITGLTSPTLESCTEILGRLGCKLLDNTSERMLFSIPPWRRDLVREIDLIEEVLRVEGFDKVPYEMPKITLAASNEDPFIAFSANVKTVLAARSLSEVMILPFLAPAQLTHLNMSPQHFLAGGILVANPMNDETSLLRASMIPGLIQAVVRNRNHGERGQRLFEMGRVFFPSTATVGGESLFARWLRTPRHVAERARSEKRPCERPVVAGILLSPFQEKGWDRAEEGVNFFHGKELVESLCKAFGCQQPVFTKLRDADEVPFLHPGIAAQITLGEFTLGYMGELHPDVAGRHHLGTDTAVVFELDLEALFDVSQRGFKVATTTHRFPAVARDIALSVAESVTFGDLQGTIAAFPQRKNLKDVALFDTFRGGTLGEGQKSMAATYRFQSADRTLTDREVDQEVQHLLDWLKKKLNATQR